VFAREEAASLGGMEPNSIGLRYPIVGCLRFEL
jgi:hypothetical protein